MLKPDGAGGDHHLPAADVQIDTAAGAHADKRMRPQLVQFLHGNGRRGAADPRGANGHLLSQKRAGVDGVFPVGYYETGVVKMRGDGCAASGIAGQDTVATHVALSAADMELFFQLLHGGSPLDPIKMIGNFSEHFSL